MKVEADGFDNTVKIDWERDGEPTQYIDLDSWFSGLSAKGLAELIMKAYSIGKIDSGDYSKTHGVSVRLNGR